MFTVGPALWRQAIPNTGPVWTSTTWPVGTDITSDLSGGPAGVFISSIVTSAGNATNYCIRSVNGGATWTTAAMPISAEWKRIVYDGIGTWLMTTGNNGPGSIIATSTDNGATWIQRTAPSLSLIHI